MGGGQGRTLLGPDGLPLLAKPPYFPPQIQR